MSTNPNENQMNRYRDTVNEELSISPPLHFLFVNAFQTDMALAEATSAFQHVEGGKIYSESKRAMNVWLFGGSKECTPKKNLRFE